MKKTATILGAVMATLSITYVGWRFSPIGKNTLNKWLFTKWQILAKKKKVHDKMSWGLIRQDLNSLDYRTHELLYLLTRLDPMGRETLSPSEQEKFLSLLSKLKEKGITDKARIMQLEGVIFPS